MIQYASKGSKQTQFQKFKVRKLAIKKGLIKMFEEASPKPSRKERYAARLKCGEAGKPMRQWRKFL